MVIMDTSIIGVALPEMQARPRLHPAGPQLGLQRLRRRVRRAAAARRPAVRPVRRPPRSSPSAGSSSRPGRWSPALAGSVGRRAGRPRHPGRRVGAHRTGRADPAVHASSARTPKELTKALALYGAAAPAGGTAGVFLGGVLTEYASWPWVFFINVPLAAASSWLDAVGDAGRRRRAAARSTSPAPSPSPPGSAPSCSPSSAPRRPAGPRRPPWSLGAGRARAARPCSSPSRPGRRSR